VLLLTGCAGTPVPAEVGLRNDGTVPPAAPPPKSPNCVSSYVDPGSDPEHGAVPIARGPLDPDEARAAVRSIIEADERTEILADVPGYLHAAAYSRFWKFPDDVEFWFPVDEPVIHFRSAARLGYGDMGVNRKRMERIREAYSAVSR
jgi:uncharacterized protein (DUF1499 family)